MLTVRECLSFKIRLRMKIIQMNLGENQTVDTLRSTLNSEEAKVLDQRQSDR